MNESEKARCEETHTRLALGFQQAYFQTGLSLYSLILHNNQCRVHTGYIKLVLKQPRTL